MELFAIKKLGTMKPFAAEDADKFSELTEGQTYRIKVSRPRNVQFHRKYFALLNLVFENMPHDYSVETQAGQTVFIKSVTELLWHIKMQLGHYETKTTIGGRVTYEAKSISFASMDEHDFAKFYDSSIDIILKYFLVGSNKEELEEAVIIEFT